MTTAATRLLVLLGHPVEHSLSPALHTAALDAAGIDAVYVACDVAPGQVDAAVAGLRVLGALGANITIPHKAAALAAADRATEEAALIGAANTLFWDGGDLVADNTDAAGLAEVLTDVGVRPGDLAVVYGAGGAARAAAVALARRGCRVRVDARRAQAAAEVQRLAVRAGAPSAGEGAPRIVVNATPLGRHGEPLPDAYMTLGPGQIALDLNYDPGGSPFLQAAARRGAAAVDGRGMLLGQAAAAFRRWAGTPAPRQAMAAALDG